MASSTELHFIFTTLSGTYNLEQEPPPILTLASVFWYEHVSMCVCMLMIGRVCNVRHVRNMCARPPHPDAPTCGFGIRGVPGLLLSLYSDSSKLVRPSWWFARGSVCQNMCRFRTGSYRIFQDNIRKPLVFMQGFWNHDLSLTYSKFL